MAPDAEVRVLLTAREEVRQARRTGQAVAGAGVGGEDVAARDRADSKVTSFLTAADGVTTVDNSDMDFQQTLDVLITLVADAVEVQEYEQYAANLSDYELDEGRRADHRRFPVWDRRRVAGSQGRRSARRGRPPERGQVDARQPHPRPSRRGRRRHARVTRDRVSYDAEWSGTEFKLVDTGGWEADVEGIESPSPRRRRSPCSCLTRSSSSWTATWGLTDTDERIVKMLRASGKPVTLAVNKGRRRGQRIPDRRVLEAWHGRALRDLGHARQGESATCLTPRWIRCARRTRPPGFLTPTHLRRVALVGRPNVGKSSLLNQLAGEQRAVVNDLAGTTRDPVDETIDIDGEDWLFIDTAGIKRRLHKVSGADYYSSLRTQAAIERSELALVLFDSSQPISDQDLKVMSQAVDAGRAVVLVFNKWDLMDDFGRQRLERLWKTEFNRVTWAQRVNLSAKTGWHTNRLADAMRNALESWDKRIPTGRLNAFLGQIQAAHPIRCAEASSSHVSCSPRRRPRVRRAS